MTLTHAFMLVAPTLVFLLLYGCWSLHKDMRFWRDEATSMADYIERLEKEAQDGTP
jgi:hypothetical protein